MAFVRQYGLIIWICKMYEVVYIFQLHKYKKYNKRYPTESGQAQR